MEYEILLFDAVESSRLQLISDRRIYELSPPQQNKLLLVKYGVNQNNQETLVTTQIKQASAKLAKMSEELFFRRRKI